MLPGTPRVSAFVRDGHASSSPAGKAAPEGRPRQRRGTERGLACAPASRFLPMEGPGSMCPWRCPTSNQSTEHLGPEPVAGISMLHRLGKKTARTFRALKSQVIGSTPTERSRAGAVSLVRTREVSGARRDRLGCVALFCACARSSGARSGPGIVSPAGGGCRRPGRSLCCGDAAVAQEAAGRPGQA